MVWIFVIGIVIFILFRFISDANKDKSDLAQGLDNKFKYVVQEINIAAFNGEGIIQHNSTREFNLYKQPSNQIIFFHYGTGILTITWRYKYFQKEVVHEKNFYEARNLSVFEQQNIAFQMIKEMAVVIEQHQISILGNIDSEEELLFRLNRIIKNEN